MSVSNGFVNNLFSPGRTDLGPGTWTLEEDPFRVALYSTTNGGPNGFSVVSVVPEPSASLLGLGGLIALAARRRR